MPVHIMKRSSLVNPITFEQYMYQAFYSIALKENETPVEDLMTFDCDSSIIETFPLFTVIFIFLSPPKHKLILTLFVTNTFNSISISTSNTNTSDLVPILKLTLNLVDFEFN